MLDTEQKQKKQKRKPSKETVFALKHVMLLIALFISFLFIVSQRSKNTSDFPEQSSSQEKVKSSSISTAPTNKPAKPLSELTREIRDYLEAEQGLYSVRYQDLTTKESFGINDSSVLTAASVIKLPILAGLYKLADEGEIDLDEEITPAAGDIQDWGTGSMRYDPAGTSYTIREMARRLIKQSDNSAGYILTYKVIGLAKLQSMVDGWGLTYTDIEQNETTNKDVNKLMGMIWEGEIAGEDLTQEMLSFMENTDFEERLPKLLPENVPVYHKIGNEVRIIHDVGIVDAGKPYYIGVMGSEIPDSPRAEQVIAEISKMVYDFVTGK